MTPTRLTELRCPECQGSHWVLDSDYRGTDVFLFIPGEERDPEERDLKERGYEERDYECPACRYSGPSFSVLRQSPPEFVLQPHPMYPMSQSDFDKWVQVLKENFPDHPLLEDLGGEFRPYTGK